jgi:isopentenyl diphosphate isomerase/L-lactate dehydrogenase-like FMN-dependent dehydrogenase
MSPRTASFHTIAEARLLAKRALPPVLFDFVDGGSNAQRTLEQNGLAYAEVGLRSKVLVDNSGPSLTTKILGSEISLPVALAPVGGLRLVAPQGDLAAMRAAGAFGTAAALSTANATPLEEVHAAATGPAWFQLSSNTGRDAAEVLVERTQRAGFDALFLTVDAIGGNNEKLDAHEGFYPPKVTARTALHFAPQMLRRPAWTLGFIRDGLPVNSREGRVRGAKRLCWDDIDWIREMWRGPLVIKGIVGHTNSERGGHRTCARLRPPRADGTTATRWSPHVLEQRDYDLRAVGSGVPAEGEGCKGVVEGDCRLRVILGTQPVPRGSRQYAAAVCRRLASGLGVGVQAAIGEGAVSLQQHARPSY